MAEEQTRRRSTAEFKAQAVKRLVEGGLGLSDVATELGLSTGQLSTSRVEQLAAGSAEMLAVRKAEEAETLRLRRELKRLEKERLWPGRRRERQRRLSLAARDPCRPNPRRSGSRTPGHIGRVFAARRRVYGSPRIHAELRREGRQHSRRHVARLMRETGLSGRQGRRKVPCTTDNRRALPIAPNLVARNFTAERPDQVWLADVSYIPTGEGWLYLAAVRDIATRQIVGWSMADHLRAELCTAALVMALQRWQTAIAGSSLGSTGRRSAYVR